MESKDLKFFRDLVGCRPDFARKNVVGFYFKVEISPKWPAVLAKQVDLINAFGASVCDDDIMAKWANATITGHFDYTVTTRSEPETYREMRLELNSGYEDSRHRFFDFPPDQRVRFGFEFGKEDWYETLPKPINWAGSDDYRGIRSFECIFSDLGISITQDFFVPLQFDSTLFFLNEAKLHDVKLEELPRAFLIDRESVDVESGQHEVIIPTAPDWVVTDERINCFQLKNPYCSLFIQVFPKILKQGEWPGV